MFINKKFILASSSKSRYKILKLNKLDFIQTPPTCKENQIKESLRKKNNSPEKIVKILASEKAKSISLSYLKKTVVGCDTIIIFNNKIIDKARNIKEAKRKLLKLSGKKHIIMSSVSVYENGYEVWNFSQKTTVKIRKLSNDYINKYLKKCGKQILGSAGCYQIESLGPMIIENIKGDFFNVMGFPLFPFLKYLENKK